MMKVVYTVLAMLLILFIITFSLDNTVPVKVQYYGLFAVEWPVYLLLFVSCMLGIIFTGCLGMVERFRQSRIIARLNKNIRDLRRDIRLYEEAKGTVTTTAEKEEDPL
ncbi:MAG: LapA family protein [Syntrophobacterales bacterium]|jgi:uncharacterized integral membrane protein|nr:LapA family protein [Syntrophobacterales bacterium]